MTTGFDPLRELSSTFSFAAPASGINCSKIRILGRSTYEIEGTIFVGGISISDSVISRGSIRVGDHDLGDLISDKCAAGVVVQNVLQEQTPPP